jgi:hypothetical protein
MKYLNPYYLIYWRLGLLFKLASPKYYTNMVGIVLISIFEMFFIAFAESVFIILFDINKNLMDEINHIFLLPIAILLIIKNVFLYKKETKNTWYTSYINLSHYKRVLLDLYIVALIILFFLCSSKVSDLVN